MRRLVVVLAAVSMLVAVVAIPSAGASHDVNGTVCLVADQGGFDDGGFNAGALAGLERAGRRLHVATRAVAADAETELPGIIGSFVDSGECDLIVGVGFRVGGAMEPFVVANSGQRFAVVDFAYETSYENVAELLFRADQAAFMAGVHRSGDQRYRQGRGLWRRQHQPGHDLHGRVRPRCAVLQRAERCHS